MRYFCLLFLVFLSACEFVKVEIHEGYCYEDKNRKELLCVFNDRNFVCEEETGDK